MTNDYTTITEIPGLGATREQVARLYHRYHIASQYCEGKRVLEVACGAGMGLGYLGRSASLVVGGDYTARLVRMTQNQYSGRLDCLQLDAHCLPFRDESFDVLIFFEALYYLKEAEQFLQEVRRVLTPEGALVLCTVNKDWHDFNPSPFSTRYYSSPELWDLLDQAGFKAELFGAFPTKVDSFAQKGVSMIRRAAVNFHLVPGSMKAKKWLKRVFYGRLSPLPAELDREPDGQVSLMPISRETLNSEYKVLYAVGRPLGASLRAD